VSDGAAQVPGELTPERKPKDRAQTQLRVVGAARAKKVARAIGVALAQVGRQGATTKELRRLTGYPLRTVQRAVARLSERGEIKETPYGWVSASIYYDLTADPTAMLGFQNLRFVVSNWRETPPPPCRTARWAVMAGGDARSFEAAEIGWEGRRVSLRFYPSTGTLEGSLAAREPVALHRAGELYGWLVAMLGLERGETARVTQIEVNSDHKTVRLEENYLELRDLPKVGLVLYQKAQALRHEIRLHAPEEDGKPLPLQRALELLLEGSPEARAERRVREEVELAKLQLEIERAKLAQVAPNGTAPGRRDPLTVHPGQAITEGFG
jgi:hypothetical protein